MKITIEGKSKEIFKLAKSVLLQLREQHEEDVQYGRMTDTTRSWWDIDHFRYVTVQTAPGPSGKKGTMWKIHSPYGYESELGKSYTTVNMEEIEKSPMRYCGILCEVR